MDKHTHTPETGHTHPGHIGVYGAIVGALIISLLGTYLIVQNQQIEQVGGRGNYKLYQKMIKNPKYGENIKGNLDAQIAQMEGTAGDTAPSDTPKAAQPAAEAKASGTLTKDEVTALTKNAYIKGNTSADILWIEYSDLECPFCKRLHDSWAIQNMEKKYGSKLALMFKHYPLPFHPTALPAAESAECVGEAGGGTKYFAFIEGIFSKGTPSQDIIDSVVKEIGLDATKIKTCADSKKFAAKITADQTEGSSKFGVNGTPGNVIINTKTGKYTVVSGAQPEANFQAAIEGLLQ